MTDQQFRQVAVASELRRAGFKVNTTDKSLIVRLDNRKICKWEVDGILIGALDIELHPAMKLTKNGISIKKSAI